MTSNQIVPALLVPFIAWRVYKRVRRNIGRQALRATRLKVSVAIFGAVLVGFAWFALGAPRVLAALGGGLAVSAGLAGLALRLTKFEATPEGRFYTPNAAIGVAVSVLFVGRLAYRFLALGAAGTAAADAATGGASALPVGQSALTYFLFGLSVGYYIFYYAGLLWKGREAISSPEVGAAG